MSEITNTQHREQPILLGFATQQRGINGNVQVKIRWKRLFSTLFLLAVIGWFAFAGGLYAYFKYVQEYDEASYTEMLTLIPFGLKEHRKQIGDFHIAKGLKAFEEGDYREGFRLLRLGVARSPANLEGRLAIGRANVVFQK